MQFHITVMANPVGARDDLQQWETVTHVLHRKLVGLVNSALKHFSLSPSGKDPEAQVCHSDPTKATTSGNISVVLSRVRKTLCFAYDL